VEEKSFYKTGDLVTKPKIPMREKNYRGGKEYMKARVGPMGEKERILA